MDDADIRAALFKIDPSCSYDLWYRLAAAVYSGLGDEGFALFDEWSSGSSTKYRGRHACRRQWEHSKQLTQITVGTLFYYAREYGTEENA